MSGMLTFVESRTRRKTLGWVALLAASLGGTSGLMSFAVGLQQATESAIVGLASGLGAAVVGLVLWYRQRGGRSTEVPIAITRVRDAMLRRSPA